MTALTLFVAAGQMCLSKLLMQSCSSKLLSRSARDSAVTSQVSPWAASPSSCVHPPTHWRFVPTGSKSPPRGGRGWRRQRSWTPGRSHCFVWSHSWSAATCCLSPAACRKEVGCTVNTVYRHSNMFVLFLSPLPRKFVSINYQNSRVSSQMTLLKNGGDKIPHSSFKNGLK